ncbi:endonuclease NucS [Candidatus Micrarchaeota archaeon]|nr:endonuclease NucS [Candidatus Micrarchaeota archaeon]
MNFSEAKKEIDSALNQGKLCLVVGNCKVRYDGRAASKLSEGDRLLVIKPDGTFLVHQKSKMNAINYQGPGADVTTDLDGDALRVRAERRKPMKEVIDVFFHSLQSVQSFVMSDDSNLKLFGSERELADLLLDDLHVLEKGLKPLNKEADLRKGFADIMARDSSGRLVAIEVKRREAGLDAVTQLARYVKELSQRKDEKVRGILCAPRITDNAKTMLEKDGLEFIKLDYEVSDKAEIKGLEKKQKSLEGY